MGGLDRALKSGDSLSDPATESNARSKRRRVEKSYRQVEDVSDEEIPRARSLAPAARPAPQMPAASVPVPGTGGNVRPAGVMAAPVATAVAAPTTRALPGGKRAMTGPALTLIDKIAAHQRTSAAVTLIQSVASQGLRRVREDLASIREQRTTLQGVPDAGEKGSSFSPNLHDRDRASLDLILREAWLSKCGETCFRSPERTLWHKPHGADSPKATPIPPTHTVTCLLIRRELAALAEDRATPSARDAVARVASLLKLDKASTDCHPHFLPRPTDHNGWAMLDVCGERDGLLENILLHLGSPVSILVAARVCRAWHAVATSASLWKLLLAHHFGSVEDGSLNSYIKFRELWQTRIHRLRQNPTRSHGLEVPPDDRIVAVSISCHQVHDIFCVATTSTSHPSSDIQRVLVWQASQLDGAGASTPSHVLTLEPTNSALALSLYEDGDIVCIVTLHRDSVNIWSRAGETLRQVPLPPCLPLADGPVKYLMEGWTSTLFVSAVGQTQIQAIDISQRYGKEPTQISTVGPVQCFSVCQGTVVVGCAPRRARGVLTVHDIATERSQSTWLPSGRHITSLACVGDRIFTVDNASAVCLWQISDISAPSVAFNGASTLARVCSWTKDDVVSTTMAVRRMTPFPFNIKSLAAFPSQAVEVSGEYADGTTARWCLAFDRMMRESTEPYVRQISSSAKGVSPPELLGSNLRWSIFASCDGVLRCLDYAPTI